jgi:large subunit ribosomal protein L5
MEKVSKVRLEELYIKNIRPQLKKDLGIKNSLAIPMISKIMLNVGVKDAVADSKAINEVSEGITKISGQVPVRTFAKKSIAGFKLREGMPIGVKVTLRRQRMWEFLDRLINLALPKVRDFQGVPMRCDGRGNYNLGIKEWIIFPEIEYDVGDKIYGMNITIHTTTCNNEYALMLLKKLGMPFKKA